jgi:diguanylate cyclase (GGDEF)-like protein/putative nucleotidyltransferase with HDIG domain
VIGRPVAGQIYVYAVIALGAVVMAIALSSLQISRPGLFAVLLVLSVISSALKVDMPLGVGSSCISLSYAVDFTALLLLGPAPTMLIAVPTAWSQCTFRMGERNPAYKTLFSMATLAVSVAAAGAMYSAVGGTYGELPAAPLQSLMAAAMVYFLVNSVAVAAAFALSTGRGVYRIWHDNFLWTISTYVIGAIAAGIAVEVFHRAGQWQAALAFIPLCLTYRTYRIYLRRIADEQRRVAEWAQLHRDSTEVLARAIQAKDEGGSCHVERVQYYATVLASRLELSDLDRQAIEIGALLHDIGKLAVPEHILSKPGALTPDERKKMQMHAQIGAEIVSAVPFPCPVAPLIRSHHERWDGMGYPSGLCGEQIPIGARILAVVDSFDALTNERPYRRAVSPDVALRMLQSEAGKAFDPAIVARFAELLPGLIPPTNDGFPRRMHRSSDPSSHQPSLSSGGRLGADAFAEIASANRETYALYEIAQSMGRTMSPAEMMTLVSAKLNALVPFSSCALFVRRGAENLRCRFATGLHADLLENASIAEGDGLSGWVARHRRPLVNGLPLAEFSAAGMSPANIQLRSALVCPLMVADDVIGTIAVFHHAVGSYTEDHRRVLDQVARQAAAVVHNALVFERTQEQAFKDSLTGLSNPRALQFQVAKELARARRTSSPFSVILLDLDDFKLINDEHGHLVGDRALQEVARVLQKTTRPYDTCIRYGGDEFVVLLPSCGRAEAEEQRRRVQGAVAAIALHADDGGEIALHVSAGASVFPEDGETYERLLARADRRMYRNKAESKASLPMRLVTEKHEGVLNLLPKASGSDSEPDAVSTPNRAH